MLSNTMHWVLMCGPVRAIFNSCFITPCTGDLMFAHRRLGDWQNGLMALLVAMVILPQVTCFAQSMDFAIDVDSPLFAGGDMIASAKPWTVTRTGGQSTFKKVEGQMQWIIKAANVALVTAKFKQPLSVEGQWQWQMIQPDSAKLAAMLVVQLHGMVDEKDQPFIIRILPGKQSAEMGDASGTWQVAFEDIEAPLQWSLGWDKTTGMLTLCLAGQPLVSMKAKAASDRLMLQMDVTRGEAIFTRMQWVHAVAKPDVATLPELAITFNPTDWLQLRSSWQAYFGTHYTTADPQGRWNTVRGYGAPHIGPPRDGAYRDDATLRTGPFDDQTIRLDVQDMGRDMPGRGTRTDLGTLLPGLFASGMDAIYQAPIQMSNPTDIILNKNLSYWGIRLACEVNPQAAGEHVFWQWGNEVNGLHLDLFNDREKIKQGRSQWAFTNKTEKADAYAEHVLAPGIEVMRKVSSDVYGDPARLPVVCGSLGNSYNPKSRLWLDRVMSHRVAGSQAPTLTGKTIDELVDILTVHYPFGNERWDKTMGELHDKYMATRKVKAIWITEEYGLRGNGPVAIVQRAMRFMEWASLYDLDARQTRLCWWGSDKPKSGGSAHEAIDRFGKALGNAPLKLAVHLSLENNSRIYMLVPDQKVRPTRLVVAMVPAGQGENQAIQAGKLVFHGLPDALPQSLAGRLIQFSQSVPPFEKPIQLSADGQGLTVELNTVVSEPALLIVSDEGELDK